VKSFQNNFISHVTTV